MDATSENPRSARALHQRGNEAAAQHREAHRLSAHPSIGSEGVAPDGWAWDGQGNTAPNPSLAPAPAVLLDVTAEDGTRLTVTETPTGGARLAVSTSGRRGTHSRAVRLTPEQTGTVADTLGRQARRVQTRARLGLPPGRCPVNPHAPIGRAPTRHDGDAALWIDRRGRWDIAATSRGADATGPGGVVLHFADTPPELDADAVRALVVDLVSAGRVAESTVHIGWSNASKGRVADVALGELTTPAAPYHLDPDEVPDGDYPSGVWPGAR